VCVSVVCFVGDTLGWRCWFSSFADPTCAIVFSSLSLLVAAPFFLHASSLETSSWTWAAAIGSLRIVHAPAIAGGRIAPLPSLFPPLRPPTPLCLCACVVQRAAGPLGMAWLGWYGVLAEGVVYLPTDVRPPTCSPHPPRPNSFPQDPMLEWNALQGRFRERFRVHRACSCLYHHTPPKWCVMLARRTCSFLNPCGLFVRVCGRKRLHLILRSCLLRQRACTGQHPAWLVSRLCLRPPRVGAQLPAPVASLHVAKWRNWCQWALDDSGPLATCTFLV